jgi:hypothetical protein
MGSPARFAVSAFGLLIAALLLLAGCTTRYQPQGFWGDGYFEKRVASDRWIVIFDASVFTPPAKVEDYALFRCAELTVADHARYFVVLASGFEEIRASKTEPTLVDQAPPHEAAKRRISSARGHSSRLVIQTFRDDRPEEYGTVYDAQQLIDQIAPTIRESQKS